MLKIIQNNLMLFIVLAMVAGLANVQIFGGFGFTSLICLLAALVMIYPSLVPLDFGKIGEVKKHWKIMLISVVLNFILAPLVAYWISGIFLIDNPAMRLGFIILALLPGGGMVTTWALKSKADMMTTVGIVLLNLLLAVVLVPFGISLATKKLDLGQAKQTVSIKNAAQINQLSKNKQLNNKIGYLSEKNSQEECVVEKITKGKASCALGGEGITPMKIAIPIIFIIFFPLTLAFVTQKILIKYKGQKFFDKKKKVFGAFSNFGLLVVLFVLMSLKNNATIFEQADLLLKIFIALLLFYGITFTVAYFLYKKFYNNSQGKALLWGSYLRYITLALGLAISLVFQDESLSPIILVIVLSYFIQIPSSFLIVKLLQK